jgi:hypothetical protein
MVIKFRTAARAALAAAVLATAVPLAIAATGGAGGAALPVVSGAKSDRMPLAGCEGEWPNVSAACLPSVAPARVITVTGADTTVLVR